MKKIKLLLLLLLLTTASAYSQLQQIKIVSFTVKNQLPAVIDNWGNTPGSLLLVAQLPPNVQVKGIKLMVQIKAAGAIVCSNNSAGGLQVDEFTTRTFSANELTGTLQGCHDLKEGSYSICVQFYNVDRVAISNEVCKEFSVEAARESEYNPPTLINPENGKVFTEAELSRPVTFRWTPLVPKPQQAVTYRLKVWQLMQGQSSAEAMRSNPPIVTKDVDNITQAVVSGIYTGPCKPPYLCDFVWQVQGLSREGKPIGKNEGKSEGYTFKVETNTTNATPPQLVSPNDGKAFNANEMSAPIFFRWTPIVPKPQTVTYKLKVWQLMQGQTGAQAMRTNQPIIEKEVKDQTQAAVTGIYTGPCKPPYLCDFVWQVQAVDREDHPIGNNEGKSELWSFKVGENGAAACSPPKLTEPADAKSFAPKDVSGGIAFRWTPIVPKPQSAVTYRLKVWQLMQGQNGSQAMRTNKPIVTKDVADITEATINNIYTGPCKPPYLCDFIWEVQALNREGKPISSNEGKSEAWNFTVNETNNAAITNVFPEDKKTFSEEEIKKSVAFRWTPIVPKPQEPVTYKLRVWQLMQGQNGTAAMRTNQPIIEKEVKDQTQREVSGIITGPCKPPYLCDFMWNVQAVNKDGNVVAESQPTAFTVSPCTPDYELKWDSVYCADDGKVHVQGHIVITPKPGITINSVLLTAIKENNYMGLNVPTTLTLPATLPASGNNYPFSFIVNQEMCNKKLFLGYTINSTCAATGITSPTYCADSVAMPCCTCTFCDQYKQWAFSSQSVTATTVAPYTISVSTTISAPAITIKSFKAELISFIHNGKEECFGCNKDAQTFGNFTGGTFGAWGSGVFPLYGAVTTHHTLTWFSATPGGTTSLAGSAINLTFTAPPLSAVDCCSDEIKFCIRYSFTDKDCRTCSFVKCYGPVTRKH